MPFLLPRFPDLTAQDIREVKKLIGQLVEAPDLHKLGSELIRGAEKILSADLAVWNQWTPAMDALLGFEVSHDHYRDAIEQRSVALEATIHHHPVIAADHFDFARLKPQRMSNYQSDAKFRSNPLFQEVYRHLDSHHQLAYNAIQLADSQVILSWNRKHRDFTDREGQLLHLLGMQVAVLIRGVEERRHLRLAWESLCTGLEELSGATAAGFVWAPCDGFILSGLIRGEGRVEIAASLKWRRDTLDRHLGGLRERLGYENTSQLMKALVGLSPSKAVVLPTDIE